MCGAGAFNRDGFTNTVLAKVVDVFFKEHSRKNPPLHNGGFRSRSDDSNHNAAPPL